MPAKETSHSAAILARRSKIIEKCWGELSHILPTETLWRRSWAASTWLADRWTLPSPLKSRALLRPCSSFSLLASTLWRMWRSTVTLACFNLAGSKTLRDFYGKLVHGRIILFILIAVATFIKQFFQSQVWVHLYFHFGSCHTGLWLAMTAPVV